jgi:transcriptional regulator with XRE-family HTH domain
MLTGMFWDSIKIKFLRKKLAMTQNDFAAVLKTTPYSVRAWEHARMKPSQVAQERLTYLCRSRNIPIVLEDVYAKRLKDAIDDVINEVEMFWIPKENRKHRDIKYLSIKVGRLKETRDSMPWEDFVYSDNMRDI